MNTSNITTSDLLAILDSTRRLAEQRTLQPLLEYIASTVFEITLAERCLITLWSSIGPELRVTISIGVADTSHCTSAEELSRQADTLLYAAKRNGKNRVVATDSVAT